MELHVCGPMNLFYHLSIENKGLTWKWRLKEPNTRISDRLISSRYAECGGRLGKMDLKTLSCAKNYYSSKGQHENGNPH